jgi:hypothetical protein
MPPGRQKPDKFIGAARKRAFAAQLQELLDPSRRVR